jgi:3-oxoacyl-[acyl-carrier protein] reductase
MELELKGQAVLVTGASRGIGRAIAETFGREGARVCICARGESELNATASSLVQRGIEAVAVTADASTREGAATAVRTAIERLGGLDVLINNVGGSGGAGPFDRATPEQWTSVLDANLLSAVWCSRAAVAWMQARGGGAIVNIASIFGREYSSSAPYTAAKSALVAMTKEMAVDLAKYRIRVNSVAPGSVMFPGGSWDRRQKKDPESIERMTREVLPWGRSGSPEEIAEVVVFLCSKRASWVSGACVPVDGAQGRAF